ncbi:MAG: ANTAR domain-containing protein [Mobilitalea sp.]
MYNIIVGFPKYEDANSMKRLLSQNGFNVSEACTSGAQIITMANDLDEGIVICGYRFADMHHTELNNYLPKGFEMLLIASPEKLEYSENNIVCLPMPIRTQDLLNALQTMVTQYQRRKKKEKEQPKVRSEEDKELITRAKMLLIDHNNMTEMEAHRYIQKTSMDKGISLIEMSMKVLKMFEA